MRISCIALVLAAGMAVTGCNRDYRHQEGPAARQAGREAYRASQAAKQDAREAERDLQNASKDFRDGWNEAKHQEDTRPRK